MIEVYAQLENADLPRLHQQIDEMEITGFVGVIHEGGNVTALFDTPEVSTEDQDAVVDLIGNHVPNTDHHLKIHRYIDANLDLSSVPLNVDFITGINYRLHPTNTVIVDGEIRQVDYYATASTPDAYGNVTYDDLVIREEFTYTRDAMGFARARVQTITWMSEDDGLNDSIKTRIKYYENDESLREGQRRRSNITDTLSMNVTGWLVQTQTQLTSGQARIQMGRDFMAHHKTAFDMYVDASDASVLYEVRDDAETAHAWLDDNIAAGVTVRAYILDALNIWNLDLTV